MDCTLQSLCATHPCTFAVAALQLSAGVAAARALRELGREPAGVLSPQRSASLRDEDAVEGHLRATGRRLHHPDEVPVLSPTSDTGSAQRRTASCSHPAARCSDPTWHPQSAQLRPCADCSRHGMAKARTSHAVLLASPTDPVLFASCLSSKAPRFCGWLPMRTTLRDRPVASSALLRRIARAPYSLHLAAVAVHAAAGLAAVGDVHCRCERPHLLQTRWQAPLHDDGGPGAAFQRWHPTEDSKPARPMPL